MTVVKRFPSSFGGNAGGWNAISNLSADDGLEGGCSSALGNYEIYGYDFGFNIPQGSMINSIKMMWEGYSIYGSTGECSCQLAIGGTKIGTKQNVSSPSTSLTLHSFDTTIVAAENLNSSDFRMYLSAGYPYMMFDYMAVEVDYTPFDYKPFGQII